MAYSLRYQNERLLESLLDYLSRVPEDCPLSQQNADAQRALLMESMVLSLHRIANALEEINEGPGTNP